MPLGKGNGGLDPRPGPRFLSPAAGPDYVTSYLRTGPALFCAPVPPDAPGVPPATGGLLTFRNFAPRGFSEVRMAQAYDLTP